MKKKLKIISMVAVGFSVLFSQAAFAQQSTMLRGTFTIPSVPWVGGGDADLNTKGGRWTTATIFVGNTRIVGNVLQFDVYYRAYEHTPDNTCLEARTTINVALPPGCYGIAPTQNLSHQKSIPGRNHSWHCASSYSFSVNYKVDGKGADNGGNCKLHGQYAIPIYIR